MHETAGKWAFLAHLNRQKRPKMRFCPVNSRRGRGDRFAVTASATIQSSETRSKSLASRKAVFAAHFSRVVVSDFRFLHGDSSSGPFCPFCLRRQKSRSWKLRAQRL